MEKHILSVDNLGKWFPMRRGFLGSLRGIKQSYLHAVDGVSFDIERGTVFTLVGESGCGKTTTGKLILRLLDPSFGKVYFEGKNIYDFSKEELKEYRKLVQVIFQDPYESLNPRMHVYATVSEPLTIHKVVKTEAEKMELVVKVLTDVGLVPPEDFLFRFPHQLSGGQRQRVALAAAMILNPKLIVADEPVSMLDMSIRASVLNILLDMKDKRGVTYLFITHDLAVAKYISDYIAVMYLGKIVELGRAVDVVDDPLHPYTQALIEAIPSPNPKIKMKTPSVVGELKSPIDPPQVCRFSDRCPLSKSVCNQGIPALVEVEKGRYVSCFLYHDAKEKCDVKLKPSS
ncbi:MAG: ABC transporter ATP-binding protein [Thaumarchaeota archaeon]|jgi:peptide/nickel transport system ATP-binding protein|nr:ABC transporter ATP-binding protein [Candidatus Terraquivivens yellowstonensis]